jgi:hypothetical protein
MLHRHLAVHLHRAMQAGPLLLQGPRGAGKTTLVRRELPGRLYLSMDDARDRAAARRDPAVFLGRLRRPAVIDDLECCPELAMHVRQTAIDLPLVYVTNIRLRTTLHALELHPATLAERLRRPAMPLEILGRFVPSAREPWPMADAFPRSRDFLWRDVPRLLRAHDAGRFERFAELVEQRSGALLDQQHLARETGVSHRTVVRWLHVLDECFLTLRVPSLDQHFGRRLVRRPKLHYLGSAAGFETEVVTEIYRNARHAALAPILRFWRDSNGLEIPLIVQAAADGPFVPCGIAERPGTADDARLQRWMRLAGTAAGAMIGLRRPLRQREGGPVRRYALSDF